MDLRYKNDQRTSYFYFSPTDKRIIFYVFHQNHLPSSYNIINGLTISFNWNKYTKKISSEPSGIKIAAKL